MSNSSARPCYRYGGETVDPDLVPCNPDAPTSVCCSANDFCLSNGICLDAGADNDYTLQGCTDRDWGEPCRKICGDSPSTGYKYLWICSYFPNNYTFHHCCASDPSCCQNTSAISTIPDFTSIWRPLAASTTSSIPHTPTSLNAGPPTSIPDSQSNSSNRTTALAIGLSLGLALLIAVLVIGWLAWKRRQGTTTAVNQSHKRHPVMESQWQRYELGGSPMVAELPHR